MQAKGVSSAESAEITRSSASSAAAPEIIITAHWHAHCPTSGPGVVQTTQKRTPSWPGRQSRRWTASLDTGEVARSCRGGLQDIGGHVYCTFDEWRTFICSVKAGEFDGLGT